MSENHKIQPTAQTSGGEAPDAPPPPGRTPDPLPTPAELPDIVHSGQPTQPDQAWPLADLDDSLRRCAKTIDESLSLYRFDDLVCNHGNVQSYSALISSLCRVTERLSRQLEAKERRQKPNGRKEAGLPPAVACQMHDTLTIQ